MSRHDEEQHAGDASIHIRGLSPGDVALFRNLADEAADKAVAGFAVKMGLDPDQPLVSQRYFQVLREIAERDHDTRDTINADQAWVRRWRPRTEGLFGKVAAAIAALSIAGAWSALWTGVRTIVAQAPGIPPVPHP